MENFGKSWEKMDDEYEYFSQLEREDIYNFCKNFSEYLHDEKIQNVIFLDRSARPAWVGVSEYWNQNFNEEKKPSMYFVNPEAFNPESKVYAGQSFERGRLIGGERG